MADDNLADRVRRCPSLGHAVTVIHCDIAELYRLGPDDRDLVHDELTKRLGNRGYTEEHARRCLWLHEPVPDDVYAALGLFAELAWLRSDTTASAYTGEEPHD